MRKTDERTVRVDPIRLREEIGWKPAYTMERSLRDTLEFWKERLADPHDPVHHRK